MMIRTLPRRPVSVRVPASRLRGEPPHAYDAVVAAPFARLGLRVSPSALVGLDYLPLAGDTVEPRHPLARETVRQIRAYLGDAGHAFDLPCELEGTSVQVAVWNALPTIPSGCTRTYGELATALGTGPRPVGAACGANPIPLVLPCHRVVAAGGRLGGFMRSRAEFSLGIKRWLLAHESR